MHPPNTCFLWKMTAFIMTTNDKRFGVFSMRRACISFPVLATTLWVGRYYFLNLLMRN